MSNALRNIYYRPEWTCGRYDPKSHVALFYNLIAGASHYFEDLSAVLFSQLRAELRSCLVNGKLKL